MTSFAEKHAPVLQGHLQEGETLAGVVAATHMKSVFSGGVVAIGVTDRRLLIQPLSRRGDADGAPIALAPADVARVDGGPAGGGWMSLGSAVLDSSAVKLTIRTATGDKLKLMLMTGEGAFARLGGEGQREGAAALGDWLGRLG